MIAEIKRLQDEGLGEAVMTSAQVDVLLEARVMRPLN
jgi:hypothetical protein